VNNNKGLKDIPGEKWEEIAGTLATVAADQS
jgi:hypothetical protein